MTDEEEDYSNWPLVKRLRIEADSCIPDSSRSLTEAADEIDRLQTQIACQPIETAPKDGTRILIWGACMLHGEEPDDDHPREWRAAYWSCDWWSSGSEEWVRTATHWRALPDPPSP